jgi:hypothetical protein
MNLENYRSDRFGQALFNALLDGFERARSEAHRDTRRPTEVFTQPSQLLRAGHRQSEPQQ